MSSICSTWAASGQSAAAVTSDRKTEASDEEVVADADEADGAGRARLLPQRVDEAAEVFGQYRRQNLGFPPALIAVGDDGEISGALSHRHPANILCTGGMLPDDGSPGGETADSAHRPLQAGAREPTGGPALAATPARAKFD
jgi:hypothetical protein